LNRACCWNFQIDKRNLDKQLVPRQTACSSTTFWLLLLFLGTKRIIISHACGDCVWPIILGAELYTTCPGEQVLVVMTHQVQCNIPAFEAVLRKNMRLFLGRCRRSNNVMVACFDAVRLFIFFLILWTLQPHVTLWLSARTLQCLFVWRCACHNAFVLYLGLTSFGISVPLCSSVVPSEQTVISIRQ